MTAEMGQAMLDDQKTTVRVRDSQNMASVKEALRSEGLNIEEGCMLPEALHLSGYDYLGNVGPFADGRITAQDESAMLAAVAARNCPAGNRLLMSARPRAAKACIWRIF